MTKEQKKTALDLSSLDEMVKRQEEGIEVDVLGPNNKPLGLKIKVAGPDSQRAQTAQEEQSDELIAEQAARMAVTGEVPVVKSAERRKRTIRYLGKITLGWDPLVKLEGEELECTPENAEKVYTRFPFIRDQIDRAAGDRRRFTKG